MKPKTKTRILLLLAVVALAGAPRVSAQSIEVIDSAGVRIVVNSGPAAESAGAWSLSERPAVTVGGIQGDLWQIRDYAQLGDSLLVVLSLGTSDVRVFDTAGTELASFGGKGQGPGEFEFPTALTVVEPDTILVLDRGAIEVFLADGTFVDSDAAPVVPNGLGMGVSGRPVAVAADRAMLFVGSRTFDARSEVGVGQVFRPPQALGFADRPGTTPALVNWYGGIQQEIVAVDGGSRIIVPPFARHTTFGLGPSSEQRFYAADNALDEIHIYDGAATLRRIVRREVESLPIREEWIQGWKERQRSRRWTQGRSEAFERAWSRMHVPESLPVFEDAALDSEGYLWVQRTKGDHSGPVLFEVFDPSGVLRNQVVVPGGITTRPKIGRDSFMAVWEDALGVETLRVYELRREAR